MRSTRIAALVLAALGFLPIVSWIPGGPVAPWFGLVLRDWLLGALIVGGAATVLVILTRGRELPRWWTRGVARATAVWERYPARTAWGIALLALPLYLFVAWGVFDGRPLLIDEVTQTLQAHTYAAGRLAETTPAHPEFTRVIHMAEREGRTFSQYPPGLSLLLAIGVLAGLAWTIVPLCGALAIPAVAILARAADPRAGVSSGATLLFAITPFFVFMSGTHMGHVPVLTFALWGGAAMATALASASPRPGVALASGLAFGLSASVRPVDAAAFAVPAAAWLLAWAARDRRRWIDVLAAGAGLAVPLALVLWINARTTGHPVLFGYQLLWGPRHDLGFHAAPWGDAHTPARGVELLSLYFLRLQGFLYETPLPSLLPATAALWLARRSSAVDRWLLASAALLLVAYWAYWHEAFLWGPRYVFPLIPVLALWTARLPAAIVERTARVEWRRGIGFVYAAALVGAFAFAVPFRVRQYRASFPAQRWDLDAAARAAGVRDAVVLVREGWVAQLAARLWSAGIPHPDAESLTRRVDSCRLDSALAALEASTDRDSTALERLTPLLADSLRVRELSTGFATAVQVQEGSPWAPRCVARLREDSLGVATLPSALLARGGGNVYVRDLRERNALVLARHRGRPVYRLRSNGPSPWSGPLFERMGVDSVRR